MEGLINVNKLTKTKNNQPALEPVQEIRNSLGDNPVPKPKDIKQTDFKKKEDPQTIDRAEEVTGNSFFNDITLTMKKDSKQPSSLGPNAPLIGKYKPQMHKIPETKGPESQVKGFNMYQMEHAKPNPEAMTNPEESMHGTKIKRENVTKDLNCTINDESILEYMIDENGYLMTEKGDLIYDDDGKVVKLTDDQIDKFKENASYEEIEC